MANTAQGLQPHHFKALQLIEEGNLAMKEIAVACNFPYEVLNKLFNGNIAQQGDTATLFQTEVRKITVRNEAKVRTLLKDNNKLALAKINEYLRSIQKQKATKTLVLQLSKVLNALSKATPKVEINSISVYNNLTERDLGNEFKRLTAIAKHALDGKGVPCAGEGRSGILSLLTGEGDSVPEEQENPVLPPVSETRDFSQE